MQLKQFRPASRKVLGGRRAMFVRAEKNWAKEAGGTVVTADMLPADRYIATNRFKVKQGAEARFEQRWATRKSRLAVLDGFRTFFLMRRVPKEEGESIPKGVFTIPCSCQNALGRAQLVPNVCSRAVRCTHSRPEQHPPLPLSYLAHYNAKSTYVVLISACMGLDETA